MVKQNDLMFLLVSIWITVIAEEYVIERRVKKQNILQTWISQPDRFRIPTSLCSGDGSAQCTDMGGTRISNCTCECKEDKSTFGLFNNHWKCTENTRVRNHGGCLISLVHEISSNKPVVTAPTMVPEVKYFLRNIQISWNLRYSVTKGKYLKCNGTWRDLDDDLVRDKFYVKRQWSNLNGFYLHYKADKPYVPIYGRVLSIEIECHRKKWSRVDGQWQWKLISTECVILKVKGKLNCSFSLTTSLPVSSTSMLTSLPSTQITLWSSNLSLRSTPILLNESLIHGESSTLGFHVSPTSTVATIPLSTSSVILLPNREQNHPEYETSTLSFTTSPNIVNNHGKSTGKDDDNSGLIAGALAGVIGFTVVIVVIVIMRRPRKREHTDSANNTTVVENAGYECGVDNSLRITDRGQRSQDKDEYSYAYISNAVSFVKSRKQDMEPKSFVVSRIYGKTEELQVSPPHLEAPIYNTLEEPEYAKTNKLKKVHQSTSEVPSHNTLEELGYAKPNKSRKVFQTCADAPIYNTLEEPDYAKVNKGGNTKLSENKNEPLYNVLEGPESEHDEEQSEEPPCYHVLEGPFPDGAPVYDVLEGPEPEEAPVYGSLDAPDPHVYGTLDMCNTEGAFKDNREYNDIVYDSVGEVVNDTGDIYQQLNQSDQAGSDVYQALSHPDKTMYLKELTESHSNV